MMTKIVGHRGAAGLALENTLASIRLAKKHSVDAIEFDVRKTKDGKIVLCHDEHLSRVSLSDTILAESTHADIRAIPLHGNYSVPLLSDALEVCGDTPVIIEIKEPNTAKEVLEIVARYPEKHISITTFLRDEIKHIRRLNPSIPVFLAEHIKPIEVIAHAKKLGVQGITLNAWLLNPLTYLLARRHKFQIMVYTVNNPLIGKFLQRLYPRIMVCTDRPDLLKKRTLWAQAQRLISEKKLNNEAVASK